MFKKITTAIVVLLATSLTLIQTQQPAQAGILDDISDFLQGADIGAQWAQGVSQATGPNGSVDVRQIIRSTQRAVGRVKAATEPEPEYQPQTESLPSEVEDDGESSYEPDSSEVEESEYEPEEEEVEESEYSEPEGEYEDVSE